jgi:hypothetical protein
MILQHGEQRGVDKEGIVFDGDKAMSGSTCENIEIENA